MPCHSDPRDEVAMDGSRRFGTATIRVDLGPTYDTLMGENLDAAVAGLPSERPAPAAPDVDPKAALPARDL